MDEKVCVYCKKPFTTENVHSKAGWAEVKISQMCEDCFDMVTSEDDDELGDYEQGKLGGAKAERERIWTLITDNPNYEIGNAANFVYVNDLKRKIFGEK